MISRFFLYIQILVASVLCAGVINSTQAQVAPSGAFQVTLTPPYPGPNQTVTAKLKAFTFNEDAADITWTVNGSVAASGKGKKDITLTTGGVGTKTTLNITAKPLGSTERVQQTLTIYPASIDILWHTNTYTPPGYRGKALSTQGAVVQFAALPLLTADGVLLNKNNLTYEWYTNEKLLPQASGRGKHTFSFAFGGSPGVETRIKVRVFDDTGSAAQERTIRIQNKNRLLYFYEVDPLRGPLYGNTTRNTLTVPSGKEIEILAEPYYVTVPPQALSFAWRVDNTDLVSEKERPNILTYRSDPGSRASQLVTLAVKNISSIFEHVQASFTINVE